MIASESGVRSAFADRRACFRGQSSDGVRQGKHFVLEVDGTPDEAELKQIAETLLANPVIEDVELHLPTD